MKAWILAVGSELLTPFRLDTNSLEVTRRLNAIGCDVRMKMVVGDNQDDLVSVFARSIGEVDLVVCTGGLGPTADDLTREAVARALDVPLDVDEAIVSSIRQRFERRGMTMPSINRRQGQVPRGAVVVENANGSAPGLVIERGGTMVLLLPGPTREMIPMLESVIAERLKPRAGGRGLFRRVLKVAGRPESDVDAAAQPVYGPWVTAPVPIVTTILAVMGQVELHLTADAPDQATADLALESAVGELSRALGHSVYSTDGRPMEAVVGDLLRAQGLTIAVGESCSGGLLASRLTDIPGSSAYFDRGVVCYSNRAKTELLDVPEPLIAEHGAVSEPVASAMAEGARRRAAADVGIGITGIAGPGGGTPAKPVGTVAIAVATPRRASVRTFRFLGGRDMVKVQSAQAAMNMLRLLLASDPPVHGH